MPRYYFNLYQGSQLISEDDTGRDCVDDEAARQFARMNHGFVALDPILSSPSGKYHFVVLDEGGQNIFTMPISQGVNPEAILSGVSLLP
ncbi:DUF6894 family protein [Microvirga sp. P5_D2]